VILRPETPADYDAARRVHDLAFGPGSPEGALVDALREEGATVPDLCLVAVDGDDVVGHIVYSRARLESGDDVLALAPVAVLPDVQGRRIGSRLVEETLRRAEETAFPLVVVLGHAEYYPRFGFEPAAGYGVVAPWPVPPEAWMVRPLPGYAPSARGLVTYARAFDAVT
jgi:putative acetyltransferase